MIEITVTVYLTKEGIIMALIVLGLALIILILIIVLFSLSRSDTKEIHIEVIRPWKFSIKIKKDKLNGR